PRRHRRRGERDPAGLECGHGGSVLGRGRESARRVASRGGEIRLTMSRLLLTYYGDDFTGSTDALECLATAGVPTMLFIDPPTRDQLAAHPNLRAVGVAGSTRSTPAEALEAELRIAFPALRDLGARHVHYKVCSTFDSSPEVGSIGRAIDVGSDVFGP